jgi:hypothetical protein
MGWGRKTNGELLALAEPQFDVFVTTDQNLKYQQNLRGRTLAILVLSTNTLSVLRAKQNQGADDILCRGEPTLGRSFYEGYPSRHSSLRRVRS